MERNLKKKQQIYFLLKLTIELCVKEYREAKYDRVMNIGRMASIRRQYSKKARDTVPVSPPRPAEHLA
jgi:hypothetical protein